MNDKGKCIEVEIIYNEYELMTDVGKYLSLFYRKSMLKIGNDLKDINMTSLQSIALINIMRYEGVNQNELANIASVDKASLSRIIRNLELQGLLHKEVDENDRRNFKLYLTDKGKSEVEKSMKIQSETWVNCMEDITYEEKVVLRNTLIKLYDNLCKYSKNK